MEFTLPKADLLRGLRLASAVADRKSTLPILGNVLLRVTKRRLLIAATDLNVSLSADIQTTSTKSDGALTLSASALFELVDRSPGDEIRIKRVDNSYADIVSGKAKYKLVGLADRDFPKLADHREVAMATVDAPAFVQLIERTLFSVCHDEMRFHLNGCFLEADGATASMVSTDGHRLSLATAKLAMPALPTGVIVPPKGLTSIRKLLADAKTCQLAVHAPHLFVVAGDIALAVKLIDGQFPPYDQVVPKAHKTTVIVDRGRLIESLRRAQLMTTDQRGVKLAAADDGISLTASDPDLGDVVETLDCEVSGPMPTIGVNPKYAVELLAAMSDDSVTLCFGGELDLVLVKQSTDDSYRGVVMPMRV